MSFAGEVRNELKDHIGRAKHCQVAELAAIYRACLKFRPTVADDDAEKSLENKENSKQTMRFNYAESKKVFLIYAESLTISEKCITLAKKAYSVEPKFEKDGFKYLVSVEDAEPIFADIESDNLLKRECCRRAYLRGAFLAGGTVTDPEGHYHLEIVTDDEKEASHIKAILGTFELEAKITHRKGNYVIYLKEGQKVVDFLNIVGAHHALMEFENARIVKEVRGNINRQVNCETANIKKTVSASTKQIDDIRFLKDTIGFDELSENLAQIARVRLENPQASLKELGEMLNPPVGKSGVNHRLRRLSELASSLRDGGSSNAK